LIQWHALDRTEQQKYYDMARKEKELHLQLYPGWSARDNYATHTKKKKRRRELTNPVGGGGGSGGGGNLNRSSPGNEMTGFDGEHRDAVDDELGNGMGQV